MSNLHGPFLIMLNAVLGVLPLPIEQTGIVFALIGAILVITDPMAERVDMY